MFHSLQRERQGWERREMKSEEWKDGDETGRESWMKRAERDG